MSALQRKLTLGKETTRTIVYNEQLEEGETSVISTPYVTKEALAALGNPPEIFLVISTEPIELATDTTDTA